MCKCPASIFHSSLFLARLFVQNNRPIIDAFGLSLSSSHHYHMRARARLGEAYGDNQHTAADAEVIIYVSFCTTSDLVQSSENEGDERYFLLMPAVVSLSLVGQTQIH